MIINVEIPDSLAGPLHLGGKADARALLEAFVLRRHAEGKLSAAQVGEALGIGFQDTEQFLDAQRGAPASAASETKRPQRDVMARLRALYGDVPLTGENAVLAARRMERY